MRKLFYIFFSFFFISQGSLMASTKKELVINGIKIPVIFEEQKSLPILNIQFIFKNSGFIKDGKNQGLAYLSSKILNEGSSDLKATKFAEKLDENAISLYSSIGFETLILELSSLNEKRDIAIKMFQKLIKSPNFSEDALKKVKTLAIGNLKRKENDFDDMASKGLNALLYKNTPLANPASGTVESISNINLKDIENFIKNAFTLNNLTIVAGGDISFDELKNILTPILNSLNIGKVEEVKKIDFTSKRDLKIVKKDTEQAYIYFGSSFKAQTKNEDNYKAKVASFILGGSGFGSRLMEEIRVKRGLAYSAYASISINKSYSSFTGYLQTKNESSDEAKDLVISLVEEFVKNGVTQEELDAAKNFLSGSEPLRTETLAQRLNRAFILDFKGLEQDYPKDELEKIQNLKLEDLNNYIKTHTELNDLTFFIVRN